MSWHDVMRMTARGDVSHFAQVREQNWHQWMPIGMYFPIKTRQQIEAEALMPSRYDALISFGVIVYFIGMVMLFNNPILGLIIVLVSTIMEIFAICFETINKQKAVARSLGNAIVIVWIVLQILIAGFFISVTT
jgi:hypothetical protein